MEKTEQVLRALRAAAEPAHLAGMQRFGIDVQNALGVSVPKIRQIARACKRDHGLALALWESGIHEARIAASVIDDPAEVTEAQVDRWIADFNSWDVCDQVCINLFVKTPFAIAKATAYSQAEPEFSRRAGFTLMAAAAVHRKHEPNEVFVRFVSQIESGANDERNFVKKAVNWALRQIGKRNARLHGEAIRTAERIAQQSSRAARWIATDALRELRSEKVLRRWS